MDVQENLKGFSFLFGLAEFIGALAAILVTVWVGHFRNGFSWRSDPALEFNWHPVLMTIGMIYLYGNSILIYRGFRNARKKKLKIAHALIHFFAFLFAVIGLQAAFDSHNLAPEPIPNLYTLHSWIGLIAVILFTCQWVAGFITYLFPVLQSDLRSAYMPIHIYFGLTGFSFAVAAALIGLNEKAIWTLKNDYAKLPAEGFLMNFIGLLLVIFASLVVYLVTEKKYKRLPRPEDESLINNGP